MDSNGNMESRLLPLLSDTSIRWRTGIQAIDLPTRVLAGDAVVARLRVRNEGEIRWAVGAGADHPTGPSLRPNATSVRRVRRPALSCGSHAALRGTSQPNVA